MVYVEKRNRLKDIKSKDFYAPVVISKAGDKPEDYKYLCAVCYTEVLCREALWAVNTYVCSEVCKKRLENA